MLFVSFAALVVVAHMANAASTDATIESHTLPVLNNAHFVSSAPRHRVMKLVVGLQLRDRAALDALLVELYDPSSSNYRRFLTPPQFAKRFAPPRRQYRQVIRYLRANGIEVTGTYPNRIAIEARGTVERVERAFDVKINSYTIGGH